MTLVYVGCGDQKIRVYELDPASLGLSLRAEVEAGDYPSFLAFDARGERALAVSENADQLVSFRVRDDAPYLELVSRVTCAGGPAYVAFDRSGRFALGANYGGGTILVVPVFADGRFGEPHAPLESGVNPHCILTDPSNRFLFVPHKGSDMVAQYRFDAESGELEPNQPLALPARSGAGPRHLAFHPNGRFAYLINENDSTLSSCTLDAEWGTLSLLETQSTLPNGLVVPDNTGADIHVSADGRFVYGSNRGHDSIATFACDAESGKLELVAHEATRGRVPRNFCLIEQHDALLVANQESGNVVAFQRSRDTGRLSLASELDVGAKAYWVGTR